jgi:hypothetical protein
MKSKEKSTLLYLIRHNGKCTESDGNTAYIHCTYDECPLQSHIGCTPTTKYEDFDVNYIRYKYALHLFITEYGTKEEIVEALL